MDARPASSAIERGYIDSYYAASANPAPLRPELLGEAETDICVVGGGYAGLSTAIALLEKGHHVTLIEAERIGWGASGRNGGQIVNGLNASLDTIARRYGWDTASFIGSMLQEGAGIIRERVAKYNISCDLKDKNLYTAFTAKQMRELEHHQALWRRFGMDDHELLDRQALRRHVNTDAYVGGMIDHSGGQIHPLNLALGEAAAVEKLGGRIFERSRVTSVDYSGARPLIRTARGGVRARQLVICGNAYLGNTVPALTPRILPVSTQIMATAPLGEDLARELLPTDICVEDVRYILDYYRLSADKRLLFGGGTVYGGTDVADVIAKLTPNMLRIFPQLKGVKIDYAWNGNFALSFTRVPQIGRLAPHTWFAHGDSGHGVTGTHLLGKILAEAIHGDLSRFDVFAKLPWYPFPGGRVFGAQYSMLGSWWYGLRDWLGV
jgi:gamma-glutamylputrescine oxidase